MPFTVPSSFRSVADACGGGARFDAWHCAGSLPTAALPILILVTLTMFLRAMFKGRPSTVDPKGRYVLITGCDSGFGNMIAKRLDEMGFPVLAGCLLPASVKQLESELSDESTPFVMDVTKASDIDNAVSLVTATLDDEMDAQLHAVINNAGIGLGGPLHWSTPEDYRKVMAVNFHGTVDTTRAMLPFLRESSGRIINIASIAGRASAPNLSAYSASKYAVEAFSDAIRLELRHWGITTTLIEPGFMKTPIVTEAKEVFKRTYAKTSKETKELYGEDFINGQLELMDKIQGAAGDPVIVRDCVVDCVANVARPSKHRYPLGVDARIFTVLRHLPSEFMDWVCRVAGAKVAPAGATH